MIPNFVNCDLYRPDPERRRREKLLIHLSNFRPVKRVLDCIRILEEVRNRTPARLAMVGDGPERGPAETSGTRTGRSQHVSFLGKQTTWNG